MVVKLAFARIIKVEQFDFSTLFINIKVLLLSYNSLIYQLKLCEFRYISPV